MRLLVHIVTYEGWERGEGLGSVSCSGVLFGRLEKSAIVSILTTGSFVTFYLDPSSGFTTTCIKALGLLDALNALLLGPFSYLCGYVAFDKRRSWQPFCFRELCQKRDGGQ